MPTFEPGTLARVSFPHTDGGKGQARPVLVVAVDPNGFLMWVLMVTAAANRPWPGDIPVPDGCGVPGPSVIRTAKIATVETARAGILGAVPAPVLASVLDEVQHRLRRGQTR